MLLSIITVVYSENHMNNKNTFRTKRVILYFQAGNPYVQLSPTFKSLTIPSFHKHPNQ